MAASHRRAREHTRSNTSAALHLGAILQDFVHRGILRLRAGQGRVKVQPGVAMSLTCAERHPVACLGTCNACCLHAFMESKHCQHPSQPGLQAGLDSSMHDRSAFCKTKTSWQQTSSAASSVSKRCCSSSMLAAPPDTISSSDCGGSGRARLSRAQEGEDTCGEYVLRLPAPSQTP